MAGIQVGGPRAGLRALPVALAVVTGAALLILRPLGAADPRQAPWVLAIVYAAVLAVSVAPAPSRGIVESPRLHPAAVLAAGAAAVVFVRLNADRVTQPNGRAVAIGLGLAAAVAEEAYFRRLVYGALARFGAAASVGGAAVLFAAMHYQGYGFAAMPLDFGAGLMLGWQRWATGGWMVPAATHGLANLLASV